MLVLLSIFLVAVNVASAVWEVRRARERVEERAGADVAAMTSVLAEQSAASLEAVDLVLRDAQRLGGPQRIAEAVPRLRDSLAHIPQVAAILVLDRDGRVIGRTTETPRLATPGFFTAHRDDPTLGPFVSDPYLGGGGRQSWRFVLSRRLSTPEGAFAGVLAAVLEVEAFERIYRSIDVRGGFIALISGGGALITRVPAPQSVSGRRFPIDPNLEALRRRQERFEGWVTSPITGERVLIASTPVRGFPIFVTSGRTEERVFAPWREEAWHTGVRTFFTSTAMLVLIAFAAWGLARRERLLRERDQRLRQAEKMEAVGRLAGGIAHDFNNILGGIQGYAEMLAETTAAGSRERRYAEGVQKAAARAASLVDQILMYSRAQRRERRPVELGRAVTEALELLRVTLPGGIELRTQLPSEPVFVMADATQLHQIVMNLCTNAIQALARNGRLAVSIDTPSIRRERVFAHTTLFPGEYARLKVEDNGKGMEAATVARLFEPFFTTKETGTGTGLGLSLVYGIVTDSGGAIDVQSAPGEGSALSVYLPRVSAPKPSQGEAERKPLRGRGERILLVDDEEPLLAVTTEALAHLGYAPTAFPDAASALAHFKAQPEGFDALVTDEVMPGLSGTQLAGFVHERRADLPIFLVSGYLAPGIEERAAAAGVREILKKPLESRELAAALSRALRRE